MIGWPRLALGDLIELQSGGTPSKSRPEFWNGDLSWVSPKDVKVRRLHSTDECVTEAAIGNGTRAVEAGTILLVVRSMILAREVPLCIAQRRMAFNQDIKAIHPRSGIHPGFLWSWLLAHRRDILGIVDEAGHGTKRIQTDRLLNLTVALPPLPLQRRIAAILGAYDDLIEVSRRRITVLEEMARTLYQEWFVHRRFEAARDSAAATEWPLVPIRDIGQIVTGKTPSKANPSYFDGSVPFVKIPDMHGSMFVLSTEDSLSAAGVAVQASKTVPAGTICVSCIGTIGLVAIATAVCQTNQQINSIVLRDDQLREYIYFFLRASKQQLQNLGANGATMGNVNKEKFGSLQVAMPPSALLQRYHELVAPMFSLIQSLSRAQERLTASRDLLLPRLISGELSLPAAECALEDAA